MRRTHVIVLHTVYASYNQLTLLNSSNSSWTTGSTVTLLADYSTLSRPPPVIERRGQARRGSCNCKFCRRLASYKKNRYYSPTQIIATHGVGWQLRISTEVSAFSKLPDFSRKGVRSHEFCIYRWSNPAPNSNFRALQNWSRLYSRCIKSTKRIV